MTKKKYCPMTIEHEVLEMNQAVAACEYKPATLGGGSVPCDPCNGGDPNGTAHRWKVYNQEVPVPSGDSEFIIVSASGSLKGICDGQAFVEGNAYRITKAGGNVSTSGYVQTLYPMQPFMSYIGTQGSDGNIYDSSGNIVTNVSGITTASLIQNS